MRCTGGRSCSVWKVALWVPAWSGAERPSWLPAADLPRALEHVGEGLVPAATDPAGLPAALLAAALGLALAHRALREWRRP